MVKHKTIKYDFKEVDDSPEELEGNIVYICKPLEVIEFLCPCGCGERVILSTMHNVKPRWRVTLSSNTIAPSINRTRGCRSHFQIVDGKVVWSQLH